MLNRPLWLQEGFGLFFCMFCIKINAEKIGVPLDGYCKAKTCQIFLYDNT